MGPCGRTCPVHGSPAAWLWAPASAGEPVTDCTHVGAAVCQVGDKLRFVGPADPSLLMPAGQPLLAGARGLSAAKEVKRGAAGPRGRGRGRGKPGARGGSGAQAAPGAGSGANGKRKERDEEGLEGAGLPGLNLGGAASLEEIDRAKEELKVRTAHSAAAQLGAAPCGPCIVASIAVWCAAFTRVSDAVLVCAVVQRREEELRQQLEDLGSDDEGEPCSVLQAVACLQPYAWSVLVARVQKMTSH